MRYGSVCSGIEAATQAWHGLGWEPAFFSDIEKFPVAVLQHHYPDVPCHGDFTDITEDDYGPIDLLVGGTPCQSFSVAGLRGGMDDDRGNLALEFIRLAQRKRPQWLVWENVPGVLSSNGGRDFGSFLGALAEIGYGFAYRVLDAQYFGVAQRRRRVFVVGYLGDWRRAAAVLFERESLSGNPAPSREEGEKVAPAVTTGPPFSRTGNERVECEAIVPMQIGSGSDPELMATLCAKDNEKWGCNQWVNEGKAVIGFQSTANACDAAAAGINVSPTLKTDPMAVAFAQNSRDELREMPYSGALAASPGMKQTSYVREGLSVRRLTPTECERLQGFPDGFTQISWRNKEPENCPDGPRYKALGNSMAVPVMKWIGERIQAVEDLQ
jgi:DNA (cytosine-5)-methyltransferase 1